MEVAGSSLRLHPEDGGALSPLTIDPFIQLAKLIAGDAFGTSVAISGDTVLVGASGAVTLAGSSGAAYVFERDRGGAGAWGEAAKLTAGDAAALDSFGSSVAVSGDTALVGAYQNDDAGDSSAQ